MNSELWTTYLAAREAAHMAAMAEARDALRAHGRAPITSDLAPTAEEMDSNWDGSLRDVAPELFAPMVSRWHDARDWAEAEAVDALPSITFRERQHDGRTVVVKVVARAAIHRIMFPRMYGRTQSAAQRIGSYSFGGVIEHPASVSERIAARRIARMAEASLLPIETSYASAEGRWSDTLAAIIARRDDLLAEYGQDLRPEDLWDRKHGRFIATADRVAHRGTARFIVPSGVMSERTVTERTVIGRDGQTEATTWLTYLTTATERRGWVGHRAVVVKRNRAARRAAQSAETQSARRATGSKARRGVAVSPWSMSSRSLLAVVKRDAATAAAAEAAEGILVTSAPGAVLVLTTGQRVTVIDGATVRVDDGAVMTYREAARRIAIAAAAID